jgi:Ca2+/Na+ antiporter
VVADLPGPLALLLALLVFVPYVVVSAMSPEARARLPLPSRFRLDVEEALEEEEDEIADVIGPVHGRRADAWVALASLVTVVAASVALERVATTLGTRAGIPDVVLGGIVLAVVTSLPNLVAAVYLARLGRGAATLSEAMNSNRVNTLAGLLVPAAIIGVGFGATASAGTTTLAYWYLGMTVGILALAYLRRGLGRIAGVAILATYLLVVRSLLG